MNYSETINSINNASAFDLYRLRVAITQMLDDPERIRKVRENLRVGDAIEYFESKTNQVHKAKLLKLQRTRALVEDIADNKRWEIPIFWINVHAVDTQITEKQKRGLGRNEISVGEHVGFVDNEGFEHYGVVVRLNQNTVTLNCDGRKWRVAYCYLFKVIAQASGEILISST